MSPKTFALLGAGLILAGACATTGSTFRSGVGDTLLDSPPYYSGARVSRDAMPRIVHLPIGYQRGAAQSPIFDPAAGAGTPTAALLADMNAFLDALGVTTRIDVVAGTSRGTPPDVQFGCETRGGDECVSDESEPRMRLAVGRPSLSWVEWVRGALDSARASGALVITLEVGQYWPRQKGRFGGRKVVELGTNHSQGIPWLTALDKPLDVLQLTGALVDSDGQTIRMGAEGLFARSTNIVLSGMGVQAALTDEDVQRVRTARRDDLPGQPLVWQVALRRLVAELTGRQDVAAR